jgi:CubicO group peptidase (beta-lactamase class C family)
MQRFSARHVPVYPIEEVSRIDAASETDPAEVGLDRASVARLWDGVIKMYRTGLYPGISFCLRRGGKILMNRAIGHARGNGFEESVGKPLVQAEPTSLFNLFSASKLVTAMLVHLLNQRKLLHLDDPVAEYIPEFGNRGKEWITVRHVLTHRAGIPTVPKEHARVELLLSPEQVLDLLMDTKPIWRPGRRFGYHALTGGFILAEVIRRVSGTDIQELMAREFAEPLGMNHFRFGVDPADTGKVALNTLTGPPLLPPASTIFKRAIGVGVKEAVQASNDDAFLTSVVPAGNIFTTAEEACRFMDMLLRGGEWNGKRIFEPKTINRALAEEVFYELDATLGIPIRYSMGAMLGAQTVSLYGVRTPRTFGHLGFTNVLMWADPQRDFSACLMCNGKPFVAAGSLRWLQLIFQVARECPRDWGGG